MEQVLNWLKGVWDSFAELLMTVLPVSPFAEFYASWTPPQFLGWLNWLFPVGFCLRVVAAWLVAIGLYYLYSIIMRWLKVIA